MLVVGCGSTCVTFSTAQNRRKTCGAPLWLLSVPIKIGKRHVQVTLWASLFVAAFVSLFVLFVHDHHEQG